MLPAGIERAAVAAAARTPVVIVGCCRSTPRRSPNSTKRCCSSGPGSATTWSTSTPRHAAGIGSPTCPTSASTRWRTTRSCCWSGDRRPAVRLRALAVGVTGTSRQLPDDAPDRGHDSAWSGWAGSGVRSPLGPPATDGRSSPTTPPYRPTRAAAAATVLIGLGELIATTDAITLHTPLTARDPPPHRHEPVGHGQRRRGVVNTSRGGLVDLDALHDAIGRREGAGTRRSTCSTVSRRPTSAIRCWPTPTPSSRRTRWLSAEARVELATSTADEAIRFLDGIAPRHVLNPEALTLR